MDFHKSLTSNIYVPIRHQAAPNLITARKEYKTEIKRHEEYVYGGPKESVVDTSEVAAQLVVDKNIWAKLKFSQKKEMLELAGFKNVTKDMKGINVTYWIKTKKTNFLTPPIRQVKKASKAEILEFTQDFLAELPYDPD